MTHAERIHSIRRAVVNDGSAYREDIFYLLSRVEELETANKAMRDAFAEWESVRTFRNDINSREWLALVAAMTALEAKIEILTTAD